MKREAKTTVIIFVSIVVGIFLVSFASAGVLDWFKKTITGRAPTQTTNVSVTVTGTNPVWIVVHNQTLM